MKPKNLLTYYKGEMDLIADQVLEHIIDCEPIRKTLLVNDCLNFGICSPATTYKKVDILERAGMVNSYVDPKDGRAILLTTTPNGRIRIKVWGKS